MGKNEETQGEDLIADFLEEKGVEFKRYYKIPNLKEDNKAFREADFYLPGYKVYIEFLGQWNNPEEKNRYRQKMAVYYKNEIPCIYLWSDNLGTLDWMFKRRLREALLKHNRLFTLFKYEWGNYTGEYGLILIGIGLLIYFVEHMGWRIAISLYLLWTLYISVGKYVKRLLKLRKSRWVSGTDYNSLDKQEDVTEAVK